MKNSFLKASVVILVSILTLTVSASKPSVFKRSGPTSIWAVIVDIHGAPVHQSGIKVTATYSTGSANGNTNSEGVANFVLPNVSYPVVVTATDGGAHKFSTVSVPNEAGLSNVQIVESN